MYEYIQSFIYNSFPVSIECFCTVNFLCRPKFTFLLKVYSRAYTVFSFGNIIRFNFFMEQNMLIYPEVDFC